MSEQSKADQAAETSEREQARERLVSRRAMLRAGAIAVPVLMTARVVPAYAGGKGGSSPTGKSKLSSMQSGDYSAAALEQPSLKSPFDTAQKSLTDGGFNNTEFQPPR